MLHDIRRATEALGEERFDGIAWPTWDSCFLETLQPRRTYETIIASAELPHTHCLKPVHSSQPRVS